MAQPPQANFNNLIAGLGQLTAAIQAQVAAAVLAVPGGPIVLAVRETFFVRIDLFYGDLQDPISWLEDFENAATANRLTDNQKLQVVSAYLKGAAATWFTERRADPATAPQHWGHQVEWNAAQITVTLWQLFINYFRTEAKLALWQRELDIHQQGPTESVEGYATKLCDLIRRVDLANDLPERFRVSFFLRGLQPKYQFHVLPTQPNTLIETVATARQFESSYEQLQQQPVFGMVATKEDDATDLRETIAQLQKEVENLTKQARKPKEVSISTRDHVWPRNSNITCYSCGEIGHISTHCPNLGEKEPLQSCQGQREPRRDEIRPRRLFVSGFRRGTNGGRVNNTRYYREEVGESSYLMEQEEQVDGISKSLEEWRRKRRERRKETKKGSEEEEKKWEKKSVT